MDLRIKRRSNPPFPESCKDKIIFVFHVFGAGGGNIDYYHILFDCVCLVSLLCKEEFQELLHKTYFSSKWLTNSHAIVPDIWN